MDAIAAAAQALFADPNLGQPATYTPAGGGAAVELRLRLTRPSLDAFGAEPGGRTAAAVGYLAASALAARPARGATFLVAGTTYKLERCEPDPAGALLRLVLSR